MASRPPASRWPGQAGWNRILYLTCPRCSPSSRILLFAFQPRRTSAIYVSENDAREEFGPVCAECESPVQAHNKPTDIVSKGLAHCADDVGIHHVGRAATTTGLSFLPSGQGKNAVPGTLQNAPDSVITTSAIAPAPVVHVAVSWSSAIAGILRIPSSSAVIYTSALAGTLQDPSPAVATSTIPVVSAAGVSLPAQASIPPTQGVVTGGSSPSQVSVSNVQGAVSTSVAILTQAGGSAAAAAAASVVSHISRPSSPALGNRRDEPYEHI
jgi:hypothetical protein